MNYRSILTYKNIAIFCLGVLSWLLFSKLTVMFQVALWRSYMSWDGGKPLITDRIRTESLSPASGTEFGQ
jgi:hypothetical protein